MVTVHCYLRILWCGKREFHNVSVFQLRQECGRNTLETLLSRGPLLWEEALWIYTSWPQLHRYIQYTHILIEQTGFIWKCLYNILLYWKFWRNLSHSRFSLAERGLLAICHLVVQRVSLLQWLFLSTCVILCCIVPLWLLDYIDDWPLVTPTVLAEMLDSRIMSSSIIAMYLVW